MCLKIGIRDVLAPGRRPACVACILIEDGFVGTAIEDGLVGKFNYVIDY
jgi:hypothetical protein